MKRTLIAFTFTFLIVSLFVFVPEVSADFRDELNRQLGATTDAVGGPFEEARDPRLVAALIIRGALTLLGVGFLGYTVYAGYMWMTAAGNEEQVAKAKKTIIRSTLGLLVILSAYSITLFVTRIIQPDEFNQIERGHSEVQEPFDHVERGQRRFLNTDPLKDQIRGF